jgi:hypothetical protein
MSRPVSDPDASAAPPEPRLVMTQVKHSGRRPGDLGWKSAAHRAYAAMLNRVRVRCRAANPAGARPRADGSSGAGSGGVRGRGRALAGAGAAAGVPVPAVWLPGAARGRAVRAHGCRAVRGSRGDVAGAAVPGAGVHPRARRPVRRAVRRAGRRREAVLPAGGGTAAGRRRAGGPGVDRGARCHRSRDPGEGPGRHPRRPGRPGPGRVRPVEPDAVRRRRDRLPQAGRVVLARAGSTSTTAPATARIPARPHPAGSTSSPP